MTCQTPFRTPLHGDVRTLALLLMTAPVGKRDELANTVVFEAADAGSSIMLAATNRTKLSDMPNEPAFDDRDYIACTIIALHAIDDALVLAEREAA